MTEVVVNIPEDVKLDAAELARGIEEFIKLKRTRDLLAERLDELLKESKLTEEDAIELGRMIKKGSPIPHEFELTETIEREFKRF